MSAARAVRSPARRRPALPTVPETVLLAAVGLVAGWEALLWAGPFAAGQTAGSAWWYAPPAVVMLAALTLTWPGRARLRAGAVVAAAATLSLAFLAVHAGLGGPADQDINRVYVGFGQVLLEHGGLPAAEYPPLALLAFAAAAALGPVAVTLPLLTLPLLLLAWWSVARLGPGAPWAVACAALWPTLVPFWEVKYDALPTALLLLGLGAAARGRHGRAGVLLGLGAAAKWFPGLALPVLAVGLLRRGDLPAVGRLLAGAGAAVAALTVPFLTRPDTLLAPYRFHGARGITAQSLPYLPLRALGLADRPERAWFEAAVPAWAPTVSLAALAVALAAVALLAWRRPWAAVLLAAAAPALFLLGNRVFSPQFLLPLAGVWAFGLALRGSLEPAAGRPALAFPGLIALAATANYAVWPTAAGAWVGLQTMLFAAAAAATWLTLWPQPRPPRTRASFRGHGG